jgi:hypothetical protein
MISVLSNTGIRAPSKNGRICEQYGRIPHCGQPAICIRTVC